MLSWLLVRKKEELFESTLQRHGENEERHGESEERYGEVESSISYKRGAC